MTALQPLLRRVFAAGLFFALLATLGLVSAPEASAATYSLSAKSCGTVTTDTSCTIAITYKKSGKAVPKATVLLQYKKGSKWVTEKKVKIKKGKASVTIKRSTDRTYRVYLKGKAKSKTFTVRVVPAAFTIKGSGAGHGVGMSQYGAYELAREGRSAAQILTTYYRGAVVDATVNRSPRQVRVQVLGPPSDSRTTTTLALTSGGFTISGAAAAVATKPGTSVLVGVGAGKVTARLTTTAGASSTVSASRLTFDWDPSATATVAGAQGSYRYGTLQVTALLNRPNVVNELPMNNEYLYGIDEVPSSWGSARGFEALKAQAIASRTYAITLAARANQLWGEGQPNPACDCQFFDDTRNQNFTGWKKEAADSAVLWRKAVDSTATETDVTAVRPSSTSSGSFAETMFFARTGTVPGVAPATASNADALGTTQLPYLVSVPDPYSAKAPGTAYQAWTATLTRAEAKKLFGTDVKKIQPLSRYPGGQLRQVRLTLPDGSTRTVEKKATAWMSALKVPSDWIGSITAR